METKEVVEISLSQLDLWSFISSIFSLSLAVIAIVLSILFYIMSKKSYKDMKDSSNSIKINVDRLDQLFNKMYADTFSIVKDTVYDMRQHYYVHNSNNNLSKGIEEKTKEIIDEVVGKEFSNSQIEKSEIEQLILKVMNKSKEEERKIQLQQIKDSILITLRNNNGSIHFKKINDKYSNNFKLLWNAFEELVEEGEIEDPFDYTIEEEDKVIFTNTKIKIKTDRQKAD